MPRKVKCRQCDKQVTIDKAFKIVYKQKNVYFCNEFESWDWIEKQKQTEKENSIWDLVYGFIKVEILMYRPEQILPKYLIERLRDLREGTTFEMGRGKVQRSKAGYPYEVILETFKVKREDILYSFRNKQFQNERQKINYMMAIIENSINDVHERYLRMLELEEHTQKVDKNINIENLNTYEDVISIDKTEKITNTKDLTEFFTEWD